jgi:L-amino acid N-acyltransferase YncA
VSHAIGGIGTRRMTRDDWPAVQAIYREGIADGHATFESAPPEWDAFDASRAPDLRVVATGDSGAILGWAAASPTSSRAVYRGVVEHSVYVSSTARGRGIGRVALQALLAAADDAGYWTVQSTIFPENEASLALHAALGFRTVGRRERIARMTYGPLAGRWRDTVLVERRSPVIGLEA